MREVSLTAAASMTGLRGSISGPLLGMQGQILILYACSTRKYALPICFIHWSTKHFTEYKNGFPTNESARSRCVDPGSYPLCWGRY